MGKISEYFTLQEMTLTHSGHKNDPSQEQIDRLTDLCINVLDPIRKYFGQPLRVSSGFRSIKVNRSVGGSSRSQHKLGMAADIEVDGVSNYNLAKWIEENIIFDQLILEFYYPKDGIHSGWVHVSFNKESNRGSKLIALKSNGETVYIKTKKI